MTSIDDTDVAHDADLDLTPVPIPIERTSCCMSFKTCWHAHEEIWIFSKTLKTSYVGDGKETAIEITTPAFSKSCWTNS